MKLLGIKLLPLCVTSSTQLTGDLYVLTALVELVRVDSE